MGPLIPSDFSRTFLLVLCRFLALCFVPSELDDLQNYGEPGDSLVLRIMCVLFFERASSAFVFCKFLASSLQGFTEGFVEGFVGKYMEGFVESFAEGFDVRAMRFHR